MARWLPWLTILSGCGPSTAPPVPTVPVLPTPTPPPIPVLDCPIAQETFRFEGLRELLFAEVEPTPLTRLYRGRVTLPLELTLDLEQIWLLGTQVTIIDHGSTETSRWVQYEVTATCETCDHASVRVGGFDSEVVLTAPTDPTNDPVQASFDPLSTAWMALGLATGDGPTLAEPIAYQQRPDLNSYVQDLAALIVDDVELRGTTGVNPHGHAAIDSEARVAIDDLVADPTVDTPGAPTLPWLLPIPQLAIDETLVVWGPRGRSGALQAVDGRFQADLPFGDGADYTFRRVLPDAQGRSATLTYPPARFGDLSLRAVDASTLELTGAADHWVALRADEPDVCRTNAEGRALLPRPEQDFEIGLVEPQSLEVTAYLRCTPALLCE